MHPHPETSIEHQLPPTSEDLAAALDMQLTALEQREPDARRKMASEDLIDATYKIAVQVDRHKLDPALMARSVRLVEAQYYDNSGRHPRWGTGIDPQTARNARSVIEGGRSLLQDKRAELLGQFAQTPEDDAIWETAYKWARAEKDKPARWPATPDKLRPTIADDIPAEELIALAQRVRATPMAERYNLMTQQASNGKTWFDVLESFSSSQIERAQATVIADLLGDQKVATALDIGTGTGKSLAKLEAHADTVVGLDRNGVLLREAGTKAGSATTLIQASADAFPLMDRSVDVASSTGIIGALDAKASERFYRELARVLKPGGVYVDGTYAEHQGYVGEELLRITATSKAMLADMIVDTVSAKFEIGDHMSSEERAALLGRLGLREEVRLVSPDSAHSVQTRSSVTVLTKD